MFCGSICTPVTSQILNLSKTYPHLNNIKLEDSNTDDKNSAIVILVRDDFCWDIVLEGFIRGKSGPVVLNTKVGYVLSGPIENSHQDESNSVFLTHVMIMQGEIIHSYDRIKISKIFISKTDIDPNDILDEDFDYERFIDEQIKFKTEQKRFEIDFSFKYYHDLFADNYTNCEKQMNNLNKKLS